MTTNTPADFPFTKGQRVYCPHTGERGVVLGWSVEERKGAQVVIMGVRCSYPSGDSLVTYTSDAWVSDEPAPPAPTSPTDAALLAAFESILDQLDTERRTADPKDRTEQTYWRTQHNAFAKAFRYYRDGVRPDWTGESYLVTSATRPIVHRVRRVGGIWLCSCEATALCWHAATIAAVEKAIDLSEQGLVDDGADDPSGPIVVTTAPDGLRLSRGDVALDCLAPSDVARAIDTLTRPAQLGQRLAQARAARIAA